MILVGCCGCMLDVVITYMYVVIGVVIGRAAPLRVGMYVYV